MLAQTVAPWKTWFNRKWVQICNAPLLVCIQGVCVCVCVCVCVRISICVIVLTSYSLVFACDYTFQSLALYMAYLLYLLYST